MSVQSKIDKMPRTKEQFEEIRKSSKQKILDAALEVFAKEGYHSSSVGAIAKTAGISQGLMYNYFKSKDELLHELMIGMMGNFFEEILPIKKGEKVTHKTIINMINVSIDLTLENPKFWKLYFSVFVQPDVLALVMDKIMKIAQPYFQSLTIYFKEKGEKNPVAMMRYFIAVMDGIQLHCMIDPKTFPAKNVKKLLIKQFA
jgi:AcrR family transcriptional regulator